MTCNIAAAWIKILWEILDLYCLVFVILCFGVPQADSLCFLEHLSLEIEKKIIIKEFYGQIQLWNTKIYTSFLGSHS